MKRRLYYICLLFAVTAAMDIKAQYAYYSYYIERLAEIDNYTKRIADNGESLWVLTSKGVVSYEKSTGISIKADTELGINGYSAVVGIAVDKTGNLWMGTKFDDVFMYDGNSTSQYKARIDIYPWGPIYYGFAISFDNENNPWAGGYAIFSDFKGDMNYMIPPAPHAWDTGYYIIMDMAFDSKDKLWIAVNYGDYITLMRYEKGGDTYKDNIVLAISPATSLVIDNADNIWFVCEDGIHCYDQIQKTDNIYNNAADKTIPEGTYIACDKDGDGNLWFASDNYLVRYDRDKFTAYTCPGFEKAKSVYCDADAVWVYTANDELLRFENGAFTRHSVNTEPQGVEEAQQAPDNGFSVTCNNGVINITGTKEITGADIYTASGTLIHSGIYGGKNKITIDSPASGGKGIYFVKIRYDKGETTLKAIIK